jgi:hypothetical protein
LRKPHDVQDNWTMDHPISRWLSEHGYTQSWLAERAEICKQYLSSIVLGRATCGGRTAVRLSRAMDGAVSAEDIIVWRPPKRTRRRAAKAA